LALQGQLLFFFFWLLPFSVHMNYVLCMLQLEKMLLSDIHPPVSFLVYQLLPWQLTCSLFADWSLMVSLALSFHARHYFASILF
jgi:hypothetical protein